jgi:hypothetical protein
MKILDKLDAFFDSQKETEQKLTFFFPILIIGFIVYYFIFPITNDMFNNALHKNRQLNKAINSKQIHITRLKNSIINITKKRRILKIKIKKLEQTEIVMKKLLNKVKFLIFDLKRWAEIYNKIPKYVKDSNLLLLKLDNILFLNNKKTNNQLVNLKMQISLQVIGNFKNVVKLMNSFEARKDFVKIKSLKTDGKINYLTIDIYGAEL